MKCVEKNCSGKVVISDDNKVVIRAGCPGFSGSDQNVFSCGKCGSLHSWHGISVDTCDRKSLFFIDGAIVERVIESGVLTPR